MKILELAMPLNILNCEVDGIDSRFFYANYKMSKDQTFEKMSDLFNSIGFSDYRRADISEVIDRSQTFCYFIPSIQRIPEFVKESGFTKEFKSLVSNNPNVKVIFFNEYEPDSDLIVESLESYLDSEGLNPDQFYLVNTNHNLSSDRVHLFVTRMQHIFAASTLVRHPVEFKRERRFTFMMHNRTVRPHRYGVLCLLKKHGILEDTDWSLVRGWDFIKDHLDQKRNPNLDFYRRVFDGATIDSIPDEIDFFSRIEFKKSVLEEEFDFNENERNIHNVDWNALFANNSYSESYFNITTETSFDSNAIQITEKSFNPFYFLQFPIFVATPNHVKKLRELYDLDMFDDVIDHSYDAQYDHKKRMLMIISEIKRIHANKHLFEELYPELEQRFRKNRDKVLGIIEDKTDYNFLKSLTEN